LLYPPKTEASNWWWECLDVSRSLGEGSGASECVSKWT